MEEKQYVTLEEMEELFAKEASKFELDLPIQLPEGRKLVPVPSMMGPLLERHLYAERLLQRDYREVDWSNECPLPALISEFAKIWMHPLVWQDASKYKDLVIDGRVATEEYDDERLYEINEIVNYIYEQDILAYSDEPVDYEEDLPEIGFPKGMHDWSPLTCDVKSNLDKILAGNAHNENEAEGKYYDFVRYRYNLNIIAKHRGGKRAAELLKMLQNEWSQIKLWKTGFEGMEEKDILEFERMLFHGFDDLMTEWEGEVQEEEVVTAGKRFSLLTDACIAEGKEAKVISELRAACKGTAPALWKVIRTNEALGYLGTRELEASVIYRAFTEYFGKLPYTERNFRDARGKV